MADNGSSDDRPADLRAVWTAHRLPLIAALTARLGTLERAEDALSDAALRAQQIWTAALPQNPSGWLYRVALNAGLDQLRRRAARTAKSDLIRLEAVLGATNQMDDDAVPSNAQDRLRVLQLCAHPDLSPEQQTALMLFHLCGLDCTAIGRAFLCSEAVIYQRISRARKILRRSAEVNEVDQDGSVPIRSALEIIYHQGYRDPAGSHHTLSLGRDAVQLGQALCEADPDDPENLACLALFHLLDARRAARHKDGVFVPFDQQCAADWSDPDLMRASELLRVSAPLIKTAGPYGLRAQIELTRMIARRANQNADRDVLYLYEQLMALDSGPFVRIDHALILSRIEGPSAGLTSLRALQDARDMSAHAGWHLAMAHLLKQTEAGPDLATAAMHLRSALLLIPSKAEHTYVKSQLEALTRQS